MMPDQRLWDHHMQAVGDVPADRIRAAVDKAREAFWASMVESFPEVTSGDMGPGDADTFEWGSNEAAVIWLSWNHPDSHFGKAARDEERALAAVDAVAALIPGAVSQDDGGGQYALLPSGAMLFVILPAEADGDRLPEWHWQVQSEDGTNVRQSPLTVDADPADVVAWLA